MQTYAAQQVNVLRSAEQGIEPPNDKKRPAFDQRGLQGNPFAGHRLQEAVSL